MRWILLLALLGCGGDSTKPLIQRTYEGVIHSTVPTQVDVPELNVNSLPLIAVYVRYTEGTEQELIHFWLQVNAYLEDTGGQLVIIEYALLYQGVVKIYSASGDRYRIIIAIEDPD